MTHPQNTDAKSFLAATPFFEGLAAADMTAFAGAARDVTYPKGSTLYVQGDADDRFFVVRIGWVKLFRITAEGEEAVTALYTTGDNFGGIAGGAAVHQATAVAVEDTQLIEVPARLLAARAKESPAIAARITATLSREIHKLQMENEHLTVMNTAQRVGCLLLQLSSGMVGSGGTFSFPYDKSLAAARLGMSPETFSRALAQLKSAGVGVKGAAVTIDNFDGLAKHCCDHCSQQPGQCRGSQRVFHITTPAK
ncbi:MAG: Crp/Fnr family transcriptional regulator [Micavibrio sp.]|nr:Crp/Fnr family transcriptional regulator [Micavibrio sp.]